MRLIDADAVTEAWKKEICKVSDADSIVKKASAIFCTEYINAINKAPTVDALPARHGRWVYKGMEGLFCSCCNMSTIWKYRFCPNCGARMDGEAE